MKKVYIASPSFQYINMMEQAGWEITSILETADLVLFTGGADVNPELYDEAVHPQTGISRRRDSEDAIIFLDAKDLGLPMVGICRGGQFLNVMNGGKMYQHVTGHSIGGTHSLLDVRNGRILPVSSTHHQMMRAGPLGEVIGTGGNRTDGKEFMSDGEIVYDPAYDEPDVEVVLYKGTRILCFQPHPEFFQPEHECVRYFHELLEEIL